MLIYLHNGGKRLLSPVLWFNKQRQQLVDIRALLRRDSATSTLKCLRRRQDLLDKAWSTFLTAYVDVVLKQPQGMSADELSLARSQAATIYSDCKDLLEIAINMNPENDVSNDQMGNRPIKKEIGYKIEDHLLNILSLPKMATFNTAQLRELIDKVEFHTGMVERMTHTVTCSMLMCVTVALKLDDKTYREWKLNEDRSEPPNIRSLLAFLEQRWAQSFHDEQVDVKDVFMPVEDVYEECVPVIGSVHQKRRLQKDMQFCRCCRKPGHRLGMCWWFRGKTLKQRVRFLEKARLCANCFNDGLDGHDIDQCSMQRRCFNCGEKHHVLVCYYRFEAEQVDPGEYYGGQDDYYVDQFDRSYYYRN